jgi:hypothetical protein
MHFRNGKPDPTVEEFPIGKHRLPEQHCSNFLKGQEMKPISRMMTASAAALSTLVIVAVAAPTAQAGEYCSINTSGMRGCGYTSLEQCQASTSGIGGTCVRDPYYSDTALAYQPKQTRSRSPRHPAKRPVEH